MHAGAVQQQGPSCPQPLNPSRLPTPAHAPKAEYDPRVLSEAYVRNLFITPDKASKWKKNKLKKGGGQSSNAAASDDDRWALFTLVVLHPWVHVSTTRVQYY